jgi:hypothetical protein
MVEPGNQGSEVGEAPEARGAIAERLVVERLRAVLPPSVAVIPHLRWLRRDRGYVREGEAAGTWWAGPNRLTRSPFEQASDSRRSLVRKLQELPGWPADLSPPNRQRRVDVEPDPFDLSRSRLQIRRPSRAPEPGLLASSAHGFRRRKILSSRPRDAERAKGRGASNVSATVAWMSRETNGRRTRPGSSRARAHPLCPCRGRGRRPPASFVSLARSSRATKSYSARAASSLWLTVTAARDTSPDSRTNGRRRRASLRNRRSASSRRARGSRLGPHRAGRQFGWWRGGGPPR